MSDRALHLTGSHRRHEVSEPGSERRLCVEVGRQARHLGWCEIQKQPLGDNQHALSVGVQLFEQDLPRRTIRKV